MAEMIYRRPVPKPGIIGRLARSASRFATSLGYESGALVNPGRIGTRIRGYKRDRVHQWTTAPLASRQVWELHLAREESRNLYLTAPAWNSFVHWAETNCIGDENSRLEFNGISPMDRERLKDVFKYLRDSWSAYQHEIIGGGGENLRDLARKILRDGLVDGDCFVAPYMENGKQMYQAFPGDALSEHYNTPKEDYTQRQLGITIDKHGKVLFYHFGWNKKFRPLSFLTTSATVDEIAVPANMIWHIRPRVEGTQNLRSFPWCTSVINDLSRMDEFYESVIRSMTRRAAIGLAMTKDPEYTMPGDPHGGGNVLVDQPGDVGGYSSNDGQNDGDERNYLPYQEAVSNAGDVYVADEGYAFANVNTGSPSPQEGMILQQLGDRICAGLRVSPMTILGDYRGISFSGGQLGLVQERRTIGMLQACLTRQLYVPIYKRWLDTMWSGMLMKFKGVLSDKDKPVLENPRILLRMYEVLEKHKQTYGLMAAVNMGAMTLEEFRDHIGLSTGDMESVMEQIIADRKMMPSLQFVQAGIRGEGAGALTPMEPEASDDDDDDSSPAGKEK